MSHELSRDSSDKTYQEDAMKTVAMIPIKLNNQRVPGKNIKCFFDGTPLMELIQRVCLQSQIIDETYIYCSDERIKSYLIPGIKYLKRPKWLDGDTANCNDIIREFMKEIDADIYVNTHATAPFSKTESIDACVDKVKSGKYDSAFCAVPIRSFVWENGRPLNFDPDKFPRTQDLPLMYSEADEAYVFSKETFKKYNRRVGINPYIHEIDEIEAMDIDYPIDFEIADAIYKEIIKK